LAPSANRGKKQAPAPEPDAPPLQMHHSIQR
jgi:hypothetical protein